MPGKDTYPLFFEKEQFENLRIYLQKYSLQKIFVLADENTKLLCYPFIEPLLKGYDSTLIEIKSGEENKTLAACEAIWKQLTLSRADRHSLLINLGGGVITDMGGFAASVFKRGIAFINIPTTVLAVVDAAIGGKTGVNFQFFKNQLGLFSYPQAVFLNPVFFKTLPQRHIISGMAEVYKKALVADASFWQWLSQLENPQEKDWNKIIKKSVSIKNAIVKKDPLEKKHRKLLNFGHTIGHAIESFSIKNDTNPLLHGEAIASGIICEAFLSHKILQLSRKSLNEITTVLSKNHKPYRLSREHIGVLIEIMRQDKKNKNKKTGFTLLSDIGQGKTELYCDENTIRESLKYYIDNVPMR